MGLNSDYINTFYSFIGTISNLTSLHSLDISGNSLLDKVFVDEDNGKSMFGHLPNLTHLYINDNRFTKVKLMTIIGLNL